jgi:hypothetical protein
MSEYRESVLKALRLKREIFEIEDICVHVRELSAAEFAEYQEKAETEAEGVLAAWVVSHCVVDEKGEQVFTDEDLGTLQRSSPGVVYDLAMKSLEISGISKEAIEEAVENLEQGQSDDSSSN